MIAFLSVALVISLAWNAYQWLTAVFSPTQIKALEEANRALEWDLNDTTARLKSCREAYQNLLNQRRKRRPGLGDFDRFQNVKGDGK